MKASIILAHPYKNSLNHAIFSTICAVVKKQGVEIYKHDLYKDKFNPVLTVGELGSKKSDDGLVNLYVKELIDSDYLFFIHPNWWGQPPAILKGYIDRVIRPPYAYDFPPGDTGGGLPIGKLKAKYGVVINTSNTDKNRETDYFHDPLEYLWKYCVFGFCGIGRYYRKMYSIVANSTQEEREHWLGEIAETVAKIVQIER